MSADAYGLTARDIAEQLAATPDEDALADAAPDPAGPSNKPLFGQRLPDIGAWSTRDLYERPAEWRAFGEDADR